MLAILIVRTWAVSKISFLKGCFIIIRKLLFFELAYKLLVILFEDFLAVKTVYEQIFLDKIVSFLIDIYEAKIFLAIFKRVLSIFWFKWVIIWFCI